VHSILSIAKVQFRGGLRLSATSDLFCFCTAQVRKRFSKVKYEMLIGIALSGSSYIGDSLVEGKFPGNVGIHYTRIFCVFNYCSTRVQLLENSLWDYLCIYKYINI